ncbi:dihydrolipoyllysine-residue acetyltransferase component 2 of pyruvate dehydrogenase complex, mitochondrial-like isoform X1 [Prosopis cineraria]|uniref:dihydrolipoyllysine-residue acetyltransferase component 2 of pyruvate dehydrogenase complex, mitochondrial-like isoform X1 n=2 Tax=Prosopis cineraria TaxID=364024 RepID=UPI00240F2292|nr:dihydrolipoyllysine-residue acetyltransferase component 2 of pyruvate dehydrogenase complex, mitochondrial-like isoform X1 [Prosopis cineraria]
MACASRIINHSRKLRNAPDLLHHERALLARCFSSEAHPSMNRNQDICKTQFYGYQSPTRKSASELASFHAKSFGAQARNISTCFTQGSLNNENSRSQVQSRRSYASASDLPPHQEIGMPSLSPTMTEGNIARWLKKEGEKVSPGEVLCEVETDKATVEMECMEEGYLAKIIRGDGSKEIKVGEVIAITVEDEDDIAKFKDYQASASGASATPAKEPSAPPPPKKEVVEEPAREPEPKVSKPSASPPSGDRIFASPLARQYAEEKNVLLSSIKGTGPEGLIVKGDIDDYLASGVKEVSAASKTKVADAALDYTDIPVSQIRKITASRLLLSKQTIPHYYLTVDSCVDKLMSLRAQLNLLQEASGGARISVNDLVIKAAALALRKVPQCNSSWSDDYIRQYHNVNVNVAVQTDHGLFVPVIRDADKKGLSKIAEEVKQLASKAKENSLKPQDYEGGTFTVSNLGGPFGIKQFCAIINPPQSGILAVGSAEKRVIPGSGPGEFNFASFMSVTLSCDHRVIDGAIGAEWLKAFKGYVENPESMML